MEIGNFFKEKLGRGRKNRSSDVTAPPPVSLRALIDACDKLGGPGTGDRLLAEARVDDVPVFGPPVYAHLAEFIAQRAQAPTPTSVAKPPQPVLPKLSSDPSNPDPAAPPQPEPKKETPPPIARNPSRRSRRSLLIGKRKSTACATK